jgi:hypothetical protein
MKQSSVQRHSTGPTQTASSAIEQLRSRAGGPGAVRAAGQKRSHLLGPSQGNHHRLTQTSPGEEANKSGVNYPRKQPEPSGEFS